jgi:chemotaxis response regulator CheB
LHISSELVQNETVLESPLRILIADESGAVRRWLVEVFEREPDFQVVAQASDGAEAVRLAHVLWPDQVDLVLMDIQLPVWTALRPRQRSTLRIQSCPS